MGRKGCPGVRGWHSSQAQWVWWDDNGSTSCSHVCPPSIPLPMTGDYLIPPEPQSAFHKMCVIWSHVNFWKAGIFHVQCILYIIWHYEIWYRTWIYKRNKHSRYAVSDVTAAMVSGAVGGGNRREQLVGRYDTHRVRLVFQPQKPGYPFLPTSVYFQQNRFFPIQNRFFPIPNRMHVYWGKVAGNSLSAVFIWFDLTLFIYTRYTLHRIAQINCIWVYCFKSIFYEMVMTQNMNLSQKTFKLWVDDIAAATVSSAMTAELDRHSNKEPHTRWRHGPLETRLLKAGKMVQRYKLKGQQIFINEELAPRMSKLGFDAHVAKRNGLIADCNGTPRAFGSR